MASGLNQIAAEFLEWYSKNQPPNRAATTALEQYVRQILSDHNQRPLIVTARAKTIESVRAKLLRKSYKRPRGQFTDRLGVRVILYHAREVNDVAALLRQNMQVRERDSTDKRLALGLREFGYRSYHLVGSLPRSATARPEFRGLRNQIFEVQIRSLLEHVWAEIEHDVIYKSGADWPPEIKRRFASIAGVLELLEHEFEQLEGTAAHLVIDAREALLREINASQTLDVPTICALLEIEHPNGTSFRGAREAGEPFPPGIEQLLYLALRRAGILTIGALQRATRSKRVRKAVHLYADSEGITPDAVSHLALVLLILAVRTPMAFRVFFPDFARHASVQAAIRPSR